MENSSNSIQDSNPNNVKTVSLKGQLESDSEPSSKDAHHPLLPQATLSNHVVVNQQQLQDDEEDDDDDWLMSDDDIQRGPSLTAADQHQLENLSIAHNHEAPSSFQKVKSMADRDWERVEAQFKDAGYREGITAGKLSTLQSGFDSGFNKVGAPLGSRLGRLRGEAQAIKFFLESKDPFIKNRSQSPSRTNLRKDASRSKLNKPNRSVINDIKMEQGKNDLLIENENENSRAALELEIEGSSDLEAITTNAKKVSALSINTSSTSEVDPVSKPDLTSSSSTIEEQSPLRNLLLALISELNKIALDDLAPPDYEAMKHEKEHLEGRANEIGSKDDDDDGIVRETEEERSRREGILTRFEERLEEIRRQVFTK